MSEKKIELNEAMLDKVAGGIVINPNTKTLRTNMDKTTRYHFDDEMQVKMFIISQPLDGLSEEQAESMLIKGMLDAGLMYK